MRNDGAKRRVVSRSAWIHLNINHPIAAWHAYRGLIQSPNRVHTQLLSPWMVDFLDSVMKEDRRVRFHRERLIESVRQTISPESESRLTTFFAFPDKRTALDRVAAWGWSTENIVEVGIVEGSRFSLHDSLWIDEMGDSPTLEQAEAYVRGEAFGDFPRWELLIDGEALVYGTEVRMRALEKVESAWPQSLFFLENARLAAILGEDLGYIGALPQFTSAGNVIVRWVLAFEQVDDPQYIERLKNFMEATPAEEILHRALDPKLQPGVIRTPDMSPYQFEIPGSTWHSLFGTPNTLTG